jgi:tetratricopeptide (TPR) repeat protein
VHPVVRHAVYETLAPAQRALDHGRAARMLAEDEAALDIVATQLLAAEPAADPWASDRLVEAGRLAASRGAPDAAIAFLRRALAEPPPAHERAHVLHALGMAEAVTNDEGAVGHLRAAVELTDDPIERATSVIALGQALALAAGRPEEAIALYEDAIASLAPEARELIVRLEAELHVAGYVSLDARRLVVERTPQLPDARSSTPSASEQLALSITGSETSLAGGARAAEAAELARRALADGRLLADQTSDSPVFYMAANALFYCDEVELAARVYEEAAADARRRGSLRASVMTAAWLAGIEYRRGRLQDAEGHARLFFESPEHQVPVAVPPTTGFLVEILTDRGWADEAAGLLEAVGLSGTHASRAGQPRARDRGSCRVRPQRGGLARGDTGDRHVAPSARPRADGARAGSGARAGRRGGPPGT